MKKKCEDMVEEILKGTSSIKKVETLLFEKILENKLKIDELIKEEDAAFRRFGENTIRTRETIKHAIGLATYTIEFDIDSLYNLEELNKLL
jgi:hypothetical protein